jgi:hypothetical protein
MSKRLGRVNHAKRGAESVAQPEDVCMTFAERHQLERINEEFLALLKREKEMSERERLERQPEIGGRRAAP